ncbi:MAG TPA: M20/M25/M40 family metallo-hydrolase [Puia sp.]|nr:M20/M25/M40 family metallo-hydrolase [Puia sp.]
MRKRFYLFLTVFISLSFNLLAQSEIIDLGIMNKIRDEGLNRSKVSWIAHNITDVSGSRLTNSPGYKRAADWIIATLQQWGLTNVQAEPWGDFGYGWSVEKSYAAMTAPYYANFISYPSPWSGSTEGPVAAPAFLLEKIDSNYIVQNAGKIKGHIILYNNSDTFVHSTDKPESSRYSDSTLNNLSDTYMFSKAELNLFLPQIIKQMHAEKLLQQIGAIALIRMTREEADGAVFVDGFGGYRKKDQPALPQLVMEKEDYLRIKRLLKDGQEVKLELDIKTKLDGADFKSYNVVGEIPGADPKLKSEVVMLGGHLDSWQSATGATDNAAGCIATMEAIRILKALGIKPKRTIRIALWSGEEQGLLGSFGYIKNHFGDPADMKLKPEQSKISVYYNLDNGTGKIRGIFAQGNEKAASIFSEWLKPLNDLGASAVTLHNTGSTDHLSFDAVGIPGFQFIQDPIDYETRTHHSNFDTFDHLKTEDLKQAATIIAVFVYNSAMRTEMIPRKPLPKPEKFIFEDLLPD